MMSEIFKKFSIKANVNLNSVYFIYNGNNNINQYLTFCQLAKMDDNTHRNKMNIY